MPKQLRGKLFCSLFRRVAVKKKKKKSDFSTSNHISMHTHAHTHRPITMLHVGYFPPASLLCATLSFRLPTAAGLFSSSKQELCWLPPHPRPHYQNPPNKESCCLLAFCWRINTGRECGPLMSSVFCVFYCLSCFPRPSSTPPAAAAHLHWGLGQLALVGGLQRGQRGDSAEDHPVQRPHRLAHHQGGAAQRRPEAGRDLSPC